MTSAVTTITTILGFLAVPCEMAKPIAFVALLTESTSEAAPSTTSASPSAASTGAAGPLTIIRHRTLPGEVAGPMTPIAFAPSTHVHGNLNQPFSYQYNNELSSNKYPSPVPLFSCKSLVSGAIHLLDDLNLRFWMIFLRLSDLFAFVHFRDCCWCSALIQQQHYELISVSTFEIFSALRCFNFSNGRLLSLLPHLLLLPVHPQHACSTRLLSIWKDDKKF